MRKKQMLLQIKNDGIIIELLLTEKLSEKNIE
jgi:hypothetical protein